MNLLQLLKDSHAMRDSAPTGYYFDATRRVEDRQAIVDWLTSLCLIWELRPETTFLCVDIVDRYLAQQTAWKRNKIQLLGVGALFIACKYEEVVALDVSDLIEA